MINHSLSFSPQCERDFMHQMCVRIGNLKYGADGVVGIEGHLGFPGNQNILSKYNLLAWITEIIQSFVFDLLCRLCRVFQACIAARRPPLAATEGIKDRKCQDYFQVNGCDGVLM